MHQHIYWSHLLSQFQFCKQFILVSRSTEWDSQFPWMLCNICAQNFFNRKTKSFPFRFWQQYNNHIISNCNHRTMFAKFPFIFKLFTNTSEWHLRQIKVEIIIFTTTTDFSWPHAITKTNDGKLNSRIYEKYQNAFHSLVKYILCVWRMGMIWYIFGPKIISFHLLSRSILFPRGYTSVI